MLQSIVLGVLVPALIGMAIAAAAMRWLPPKCTRCNASGIAAASAFFIGYVLLPAWAPLKPVAHWHWLPYLAALASLAGPWLLYGAIPLLLCVASAWFLVPRWPDLQPARPTYLVLLSAYLLLLIMLLRPLSRVSGRVMPPLLLMSSAALAVLLAANVSLMFGQVAMIATASMVGGYLGTIRDRDTDVCGWVPVYAVLTGGMAFVGYVEPDPPVYAFLLIPLAPLAAAVISAPPLRGLSGTWKIVAQLLAVVCVLIAAAVWAWYDVAATEW